MKNIQAKSCSENNRKPVKMPPGRVKIVNALKTLLKKKDFNAITTAEIARSAGVTEALIYKYFKDKRDLLHQILREYLEQYCSKFELDLKGIKGACNKIRKLIWAHIHAYATNRIFAKILLIEVRNYPDYYKSETYEFVKKYCNVLLDAIEEGIAEGEIRDDISARMIRQSILGAIEHACLTEIIFDREISPDQLTDDICEFAFRGIEKREA
ncbi:MAG: TetR family transcriptional regulator [Desulfobacteraceae bacterium 4572_123]|nr:MAG: TetR family transcriptional regulator [Desulfobacteraceae bacterium 4572_123]